MVGIRFLKLQTKESQNFLKAINQVDTFKISSYEIKKEILKGVWDDEEIELTLPESYGYGSSFDFSGSNKVLQFGEWLTAHLQIVL